MFRKKYSITLAALMLFCNLLWSQGAVVATKEQVAQTNLFNNIMFQVFAVAVLLIGVVAIIFMIKVNTLLYKRILHLENASRGIADPSANLAADQGPSWWDNFKRKYWEDVIPLEREQEVLMHHNYDGIQELDNNLPPWWVNMFYLTIVFAGIYMYYYHFGGNGPSSIDEYNQRMEVAKVEKARALAAQANKVDESSVVALTEKAALGEGETIFKNLCAACHGQKGEGGVGPNMTDEYWLHGGGIKNIFKTVKYGVPEKGMISWASQLGAADMQKVSSYILTLQGTNPPNAKAAQGVIWQDSTAAAQPKTLEATTPK